jgi:hypothetical protein
VELDGFNYFTDDGFTRLAESLTNDSKLQSLSIFNSRNYKLYDTISQVISKSKLKYLNLGHVRYNTAFDILVCTSLKYVENIFLNNIALSNAGLKGCFIDSKVKTLSIFQSNLDNNAAIQIAKELQRSQLSGLSLNYNFIERKGYNAILASKTNILNKTIKFNFPNRSKKIIGFNPVYMN